MNRIRIEIPSEADPSVVKALRAVGATLGAQAGEVEITSTAPPDSYSLTVHVLPDKKKEE